MILLNIIEMLFGFIVGLVFSITFVYMMRTGESVEYCFKEAIHTILDCIDSVREWIEDMIEWMKH